MLSVAIIDIIGLTYDGDTLKKRGLGGSESAVILMADELQNLGFEVTVFNNCIDREAKPGIYNDVTYVDLTDLQRFNDYSFDVVISSRTVFPFLKEQDYAVASGRVDAGLFAKIKANAKFKALWLHDTFCQGDHLVEQMVVDGDIDELFTLSDFHTSYISTCNHGNKRMPEVLKRKMFQTRNGAVLYPGEVDINAKDHDLFVYNASVTKGMLPLVKNIWPIVKRSIPSARLKVIGGYYRFRENAEPDEQEKVWREMVADPAYKAMGVEFTGIIKQSEIAEILKVASFMIYPPEFPETFGISTLESLLYNTPLITARFGALEETAVDQASYFIDYPVVPNSLFPNIDTNAQTIKFATMAVQAWHNTYLHAQKMQYCNIVKGIHGWDTVALQWKQHLYNKLGQYMSVDEYRKVSAINARVHQVFGRRFANTEEFYIPRAPKQQSIIIVTPMYNAEQWIEKCIVSVACQDYDEWKMIVIDDCSTDKSYPIALTAATLYGRDRVIVVRNDENRGAVYNQITACELHCEPGDIVMLLDGDDALMNNPQIFHMYNNLYDGTTDFSYGSCWSMVDNIPLIAQPYPEAVKKAGDYRNCRFAWNMPYTHLRTFRAGLLEGLPPETFLDDNGEWYKAGGDGAVFYALIERANPDYVKVVQDIVYLYNDTSPINDYKINGEEQTRNAQAILAKKPGVSGAKPAVKAQTPTPVMAPVPTFTTPTPVKEPVARVKTILIAIPTAKYIEPETMKSIYNLEVPDGYETTFQYFFGYNVDQVRNLIAEWATKFDYLFAVDSDMSFAPDTLKKLLAHDKDVVSGLYIQRKPGQHILELYRQGRNIPYDDIRGLGLIEVDGCGFGCVLIKSNVIRSMGYPQFVYKSALDHANTVSEDTYFCLKAKALGFRVWADTSIQCGHHGASTFIVDPTPPVTELDRLRDLSKKMLLPVPHVQHLQYMKACGHNPKVIYDLGGCVLHWTSVAEQVWPDAEFYVFEAMPDVEPIYQDRGIKNYHLGVMTDVDGRELTFYQNTIHPGGNSYYKENAEVNAVADTYFNETHARKVVGRTLDSVVAERGWPVPELVKMDVQGAELDVLKGAKNTLSSCKNLILELQNVEYNKGAPLKDGVIEYLNSIGFVMAGDGPFCDNGPDGDYQFIRL